MNRQESFAALTITRLRLRLTGASVELLPDDVQDLQLLIAGDDRSVSALQVTSVGDCLSVTQPFALRRDGWLQLVLRLPRSWKGSIRGRTLGGPVILRGLSGADVRLSTLRGSIAVAEAEFLTLSARSLSGSITLNGVGCSVTHLASLRGRISALDCALSGYVRVLSGFGRALLALQVPFQQMTLGTLAGEMHVEAPLEDCDAVLRSLTGKIRTDGLSIRESPALLRALSITGSLDLISTLTEESQHP